MTLDEIIKRWHTWGFAFSIDQRGYLIEILIEAYERQQVILEAVRQELAVEDNNKLPYEKHGEMAYDAHKRVRKLMEEL